MPEAGWYDDPESGLHIRYWDGSAWTADRRPKPPATPPPAGPPHQLPAGGAGGLVSEKSFVATLLLALIVGPLGVHRFYVGKVGTGILHLVTLGAFGIWTLVDIVLIAVGRFTDGSGASIRP